MGDSASDESELLAGWADAMVGRLPRANGGSVLVLAAQARFDDEAFLASVAEFGTSSWELPMHLSERAFGWVAQDRADEVRGLIEFNGDRLRLPSEAPLIGGFVGSVRPWAELPDEDLRNRDDLCGVLVCGDQSGPILFVDQRARCNHQDLGATATTLAAQFDSGHRDGGWDEVAPGLFLTGLLTSRSAEQGSPPDR